MAEETPLPTDFETIWRMLTEGKERLFSPSDRRLAMLFYQAGQAFEARAAISRLDHVLSIMNKGPTP